MVLLVAGVVLLLGALVAVLVVAARRQPAPAPEPVSAVEPWCVDPVTQTLVDDDWCEGDDDDFEGFVIVPGPGWKKPAVGATLPPQARSVRPSPVVRVSSRPGVRVSVPPSVVSGVPSVRSSVGPGGRPSSVVAPVPVRSPARPGGVAPWRTR